MALVTGGGSVIGLEMATDLANRGARVIIASRNEAKLQLARDHIDVDDRLLDLESFQSVRQFTKQIVTETRLDILVNNAGGFGLPDTLTGDGLNLMMQVNFYSVFLLTYLLLPLPKSSAPNRIINSSAETMCFGEIDLIDIGRYNMITASGNSKLAEALITLEWDRRIQGKGVTANSYDPWYVDKCLRIWNWK